MTRFRPRPDKERPLAGETSRLIADTEAFLSGEYASHLRRRSDAVPSWAQLNKFAHGDVDTLWSARRVRKPATFAGRSQVVWRTAHQLLAGEIIELVGSDPWLLSRLQRNTLVPLELQLMREGDLTAFELVQITRSALRSAP